MTPEIRVAYVSPFVPVEWIAAHGCAPVRVVPRAAHGVRFDGQGVCYYCHSLAEELCRNGEVSGIVLATTCDQMRRMAERLAGECPVPVFLLNVPATWQTESSRTLYGAELRRLGDFLVELGGHRPSPDDLLASARTRNEEKGSCSTRASNTIPLAFIGSPELREHHAIVDCIRRAGGHIELDGRTGAERTRAKRLDLDLVAKDPIAAFVEAYFDSIPDAFRRPNHLLFDWLDSAVSERKVRGAIVGHYVWCDHWRAEAFRIKERLKIPSLIIDYDEGPELSERTAGRLAAFLETLQ